MSILSRRTFLQSSASLALAGTACRLLPAAELESNLSFGLVTYMWGADWDLPTLIANCQKTQVLGVELRTTHKHGVEPNLNEAQREEVRKRFGDSGVTMVGIGSNERFDSPDPVVLKKAIEATKEFIRLSHDVGGSGVKVKPDTFHKEVPREKTIQQIGEALIEVAEYGSGFGQQIRLEVHGQCAELPTIKAIMDVAKHENAAVCWNSNPQDLNGEGLEHNFKLVRSRFGDTAHVRELNDPKYPFGKLIELMIKSEYTGWVLLEASSKPADLVQALADQRSLFDQLVKHVVQPGK